ncbi:GDSL-type esterase/lipase family protein [Roseospira goensis]|uniref:Lysophospholipase L1-like esterase n=1 Tax=Roseospira goensis TaxID=391922 RepID=A0A7W6WJ47_9PROT|nr:GDSL-type esterase/lipase family protein [Roseospira goensis]MBB4284640.1 lysophospholipase L1-like esterase [Roseospira goensis]
MRTILVFGDSNAWGWVPADERRPLERFAPGVPWPEALAARLGTGTRVLVDAVPARTTDLDDAVSAEVFAPLAPRDFNGRARLPAALVTAGPVDLVVLALGTNDLKTRFARTPEAIADAVVGLADTVHDAAPARAWPAPPVLILAPPPLGPLAPWTADSFGGRQAVSEATGPAVVASAAAHGLPVVEAGAVLGAAHGVDGVHYTAADHTALADALHAPVRALLEPPGGRPA